MKDELTILCLVLFNPSIILIMLIWGIPPQLDYELLKGRDPVYLIILIYF